jgi:hypothetical protein
MRSVLACLLALGLAAVAAPALAGPGNGVKRAAVGGFHPGIHRPRAFVHPGRLRDHHARLGRDRFGRRLGYGRTFSYAGRFGAYPYPYGYDLPPQAAIVESPPEPSVPTIPTALGIRAAPVGQPTVYVLNAPPPGRSAVRPNARVVQVGEPAGEDGPRVIQLSVPRDPPRRASRR